MCVYWSRNVCATAPRLSWDALQRAQLDPPCVGACVFLCCVLCERVNSVEASGASRVVRPVLPLRLVCSRPRVRLRRHKRGHPRND
jgi:hypothetical protein